MHYDLWHHARQEEAKEAQSEPEIGPIVSIFHNLQCIAFEIHRPVEIHFVKCLHWYFTFAMIPCSILLIMKLKVMFHRSAGISSFLIFAGRDGRSSIPKRCKDRNCCEYGEE